MAENRSQPCAETILLLGFAMTFVGAVTFVWQAGSFVLSGAWEPWTAAQGITWLSPPLLEWLHRTLPGLARIVEWSPQSCFWGTPGVVLWVVSAVSQEG